MELEAPHSDSTSIRSLHIAYGRATDTCQIRKERVLSAGLSIRIQSDTFATEQALNLNSAISCKDVYTPYDAPEASNLDPQNY